MKVLGLDPSLTGYGWAIHDTDAEGPARCVRRGRWSTPAKQLFIDRYMCMRESLRGLVRQGGFDRMALEFPIFNSDYSEGLYGLFLFTSEAIYTERQDVVFFSNGQIKSHAAEFIERPTGWKMGKADMVETAQTDLKDGRSINHNEADAYLCAKLGARFWLLHDGLIEESDLTPVEKRTFTLIHKYTRGKKAGKEHVKGVLNRENERFFRWSQIDGKT